MYFCHCFVDLCLSHLQNRNRSQFILSALNEITLFVFRPFVQISAPTTQNGTITKGLGGRALGKQWACKLDSPLPCLSSFWSGSPSGKVNNDKLEYLSAKPLLSFAQPRPEHRGRLWGSPCLPLEWTQLSWCPSTRLGIWEEDICVRSSDLEKKTRA